MDMENLLPILGMVILVIGVLDAIAAIIVLNAIFIAPAIVNIVFGFINWRWGGRKELTDFIMGIIFFGLLIWGIVISANVANAFVDLIMIIQIFMILIWVIWIVPIVREWFL